MRSPGSLALVATTALVLTLAGCAGGPGAEKAEEQQSPLGEYLSAAWGGDLSPEEQQKKYDEQHRQTEELVAECMSKEGFEYKPNTQNSGTIVTGGEEVVYEPDKKSWVEKYGYGMVNSPYNEQMEEQPTDEMPKDPNQEYLDSLSPSEQTAYSETLYGAPSEEDISEDGSYEYKWEDAGCMGWAQHEIQGDDPWQADEFKGLTDKMNELWTNMQEAPEFKELNAAWSSCMADAGEPGFTTQAEASQSISDEQQKIYEAAYGDGTTEIENPEEIPDPNKSPEMKKLGEREIELALKDLECREKTSYTKKQQEIQFALEEKFIADNKAELEAFKAAAEQSN